MRAPANLAFDFDNLNRVNRSGFNDLRFEIALGNRVSRGFRHLRLLETLERNSRNPTNRDYNRPYNPNSLLHRFPKNNLRCQVQLNLTFKEYTTSFGEMEGE